MKKAAQSTPNQHLSSEREQRGWSQQEVADRIGTTPVNISRWERGLTLPGPYFRQKLCALFGKSAQELRLVAEAAPQESSAALRPGPGTPAEQHLPHIALLPPTWNVPQRRNPLFTGREDVLTRLHNTLRTVNPAFPSRPQALSGLGGIGKTQTAVEYAYRYGSEYQAVLWARADTRQVLIADLVTIAQLLRLPEQQESAQDTIVAAVKRWLQEHTGWLLILDNVEEPVSIEEYLPTPGSGHMLLITRAQSMGGLADSIEIKQMEPEEGALLLLRRAGIIDRQAPLDAVTYTYWTKAKQIAQLMDGLPLALDQAAAYIEETACGLSGYLERYRTRHSTLLGMRGYALADHPEPVATTWSLSFEQVEQANPAAAELLRLCTLLYPDAIPEEIITLGAPELGALLEPVAADLLTLDAAILVLRKFSLVRRSAEEKLLTLHRLVQTVLLDQMDVDTQRWWAERAVRAVYRAFPDSHTPASWPQRQRCLPHAQACASLIEQWRLLFPEAILLLTRTAGYLQERGQYAQAEPLYRQALSIREQTLGADHPDVAESLNDLALLDLARGHYAQARHFAQRVLSMRERMPGSDHPDFAAGLNTLAQVYFAEGAYEQAEPLLQQALSIREKVLGPAHLDTAESLNNLAMLYHHQGKHRQAEPLYQRILAIVEHELGPTHPYMTLSLNNLAEVCRAQGKYTQAEQLLQQALVIRTQTLGPEHPDLAYSLNNLAETYRAQGKYTQAEPLYQQALDIWEQALGQTHPNTATSLNNLAALYRAQGRLAQAEQLCQRALAIRQRVLAPDHPAIALSLITLAGISYDLGRYTQAEALCQQALTIQEAVLKADHPSLATSIDTLARIYQAQQRYTEAEPLFKRALAIRERALGAAHPDVAASLEHYADLLRQTGRASEAEALFNVKQQ